MASTFTSDTRYTYVQSTLSAQAAQEEAMSTHQKCKFTCTFAGNCQTSWPRREWECLRSEHCNIGPRGYLPAVLHKQSSNQSIQILSLPSNSLSQCLDGNYKISLMIFSLPEMCNCRSVQLSRDGRLTVTCILYLQPIFLRDYRTQLYLCDIFNHVKHAVFLGLHYIRALI